MNIMLTLDESVKGHQHQWLAGGYDQELNIFRMASMVVTWWIVAVLRSDTDCYFLLVWFDVGSYRHMYMSGRWVGE